MNPAEDVSPYYIEDTHLLRFLINRYAEMLRTEQPRLSSVWKGLGLVGLYQNAELRNAFKTLINADSYTVAEILTSSIDLFLAELNRLGVADAQDYLEKKVERPPISPRTARRFLFWSWREGRKMGREEIFEFYPIWELISCLVLGCDEEIKEFEEKCRFSAAPTREKLEHGLEIVKKVLFKARQKSSTSFQNN